MVGENVAHVTIFPCLYISVVHTGTVLPNILAAAPDFIGFCKGVCHIMKITMAKNKPSYHRKPPFSNTGPLESGT